MSSANKRYPATLLATPCIPWDEEGRLMEAAFRSQIRMFLDRDVRHLYVFGTAGEGYAVTDAQYERIVSAFAEEMNGPDRYPMVGHIHLSLPAMLQRIRFSYGLGIRDFQFALPSWGALSDRELDLCFETLLAPFPDCRFMHYNLGRAKRLLTPDEYIRYAEKYPNFVGVKYTTDQIFMLHKLVAASGPLQFFFGEEGYAYASLIGECGLLASLVNSNLQRAWEFVAAGANKDGPKLLQYASEAIGMLEGLLAIAGDDKIDGAYDKALFRMVDPQFPLRMLPPYSAISEEQAEQYRTFLRNRYPQWLEETETDA